MLVLGIDIGGTNIKYGVVSQSGKLLSKSSIANNSQSTKMLIDTMRSIVDEVSKDYVLDGIAFTVPAITNPHTGEVLSEGSMPFLLGTSVKKELEAYYDIPIHSENDGNCAALAEVWIGAAQHHNDVCMVVFGTGIGGAVIKDRKMHGGKQFLSGEFGYMMSEWDYDKNEFLIWSDTGGLYTMRMSLAEKVGYDVTGKDIFDLAEQGNEHAIGLVKRFYRSHAVGLYNLQYMYDPEVIVLGGAVSERDDFIPLIEESFDILYDAVEIAPVRPKLVKAKYGNDANIIGAVYHFMQKEGKL
jgi:glucokinase